MEETPVLLLAIKEKLKENSIMHGVTPDNI
jgi:hypothetical protein